MIIFYSKSDGNIFSCIHGRVHLESQLNMITMNPGMKKEDVGQYVIGLIENKDGSTTEYNIDKFDILEKFEDETEFSPLDFKIIEGEFIEKTQ